MRSREVHTDPCPENQATLLAYHDPRAVQVSSLILVHDPWCPSTIPVVDGLFRSTVDMCKGVDRIVSMDAWCGAPLPMGIARTRPCNPCSHSRWSSYLFGSEVLLSGLVHVTTCACFPELRPELFSSSIFSRMARDASSNQVVATTFPFLVPAPAPLGRGGHRRDW